MLQTGMAFGGMAIDQALGMAFHATPNIGSVIIYAAIAVALIGVALLRDSPSH